MYPEQDEQEAKKKYTTKIILITSFIWISIIITITILLLAKNKSDNAAQLSNVTNSSMVQGYLVGYQQCYNGLIDMINTSTRTCQLIRVNMSSGPIELVPTICLNTTRGR